MKVGTLLFIQHLYIELIIKSTSHLITAPMKFGIYCKDRGSIPIIKFQFPLKFST